MAPEAIEEQEKEGERVSMEEDADRMREQAFVGQEWSTKYFGSREAPASEYRVSLRGEYYYLETLSKAHGQVSAYGYVGLMVHESDMYNLTACLVKAVRDKQSRENSKK